MLETSGEGIKELEYEKTKHEASMLVDAVRAGEEYQTQINKRAEVAREKSGEDLPLEEIVSYFEGKGDLDSPQSGVEGFKTIFWDYVDDYMEKHEGKVPFPFVKEGYPFEIQSEYNLYKIKHDQIERQSKRLRLHDVFHTADKGKSDVHDKLASLLYKNGYVPSHLWGRLIVRQWLVGERIDVVESARQSDMLRRYRDAERTHGIDPRFIDPEKLGNTSKKRHLS